MTHEFSWIPGTAVLLLGLVFGLWTALRLRRQDPEAERRQRVHDLELLIADLESRRDEIYSRLRGESGEALDVSEVNTLEISAARVLRELDQARDELTGLDPKRAKKARKAEQAEAREAAAAAASPAAAPAATVSTPLAAARHPFSIFLYGVGLASLVFLLILWAQGDAKPGERMAPGPPPAQQQGGMPADHPSLEGLPQDLPQRTAALRERIEANPEDLVARKELALVLMSTNQFFEAFNEAQAILERQPDDPDGLYVAGVVRLAMGQPDVAVQMMDRVLGRFPQHVLAYVVRGMAQARLGDNEAALASWRDGLAAAGGRHPDIEALIAELEAESGAGGSAPAGGTTSSTAAPPASAAPAAGPHVYRVVVEVAPGLEVAPGSSLFISVIDPEAGGGPPAAVRRVAKPEFPVEVELTERDSMMGVPLPASGVVLVQLDSDGNPGTQSPTDRAVQSRATSGQVARIVLR